MNPEILDFLNQLKANNNRDWFEQNKPQFKKLSSDFKNWVNQLQDQFSMVDEIEQAKIFRIYRDVRFSNDKTPYKTHFSVNLIRQGKQKRGSYYVHIEPGNSFIASGFYAPESKDLYRIRKEFEIDDQPIRSILASEGIQKQFNGELKGEELKTAPRDFDKNDPAIDLIRKKQFYFSKEFSDKDVLGKTFLNDVSSSLEESLPFLNYMSEVLTTNLNGEPIED